MNTPAAPENRVARYVLGDDDLIDQATELVIVDHIPSPNGTHNAGDLHFGADKLLYISVGDGGCSLTDAHPMPVATAGASTSRSARSSG